MVQGVNLCDGVISGMVRGVILCDGVISDMVRGVLVKCLLKLTITSAMLELLMMLASEVECCVLHRSERLDVWKNDVVMCNDLMCTLKLTRSPLSLAHRCR